MKAIDLLLNRQSHPLLSLPAPDDEEIDLMIRAALRAPDHAYLQPWRFILVRGSGLDKLGDLFVEATRQEEPETPLPKLQKLQQKPHRAPLIITVVAKTLPHPKVPEWEQLVSAGCAAHSIVLSAQELGYAAMWRTGGMAENAHVKKAMGLSNNECIVGFIYIGTQVAERRVKPRLEPGDYLSEF